MDTKTMIRSFKQGGTGNCVSVAVIKAAVQIFGLDNVFNHYWQEDICSITMRDGFECSLSRIELELATEGSEFILLDNKGIYDYANLCFAAMSKRAQIEENDDIPEMSFGQAIKSLNNGEYYTHGPDWLGIRFNIRNTRRKYIWQYKGVVGASRKHCFFASEGYEDDYGRIDKIKGLERRFCKWYRIIEKQDN